MQLEQLFELKAQQNSINKQIVKAELALIESLKQNPETLTCASGSIRLVEKKARKNAANESDEVRNLKGAIQAEKQEMAEANAEIIYQIEQQIVKLEAEIRQMSSSIWLNELERQLVEKQEQAKANNNFVYTLEYIPTNAEVSIPQEYVDIVMADHDEIIEQCGVAFNPSRIKTLVKNYEAGKFGVVSFQEAWDKTKAQHIQQKLKC